MDRKTNKLRDWKDYSSEVLDLQNKNLIVKETRRLKKDFARNYLKINDSHIEKKRILIDEFLKEDKIDLIVPMREKEDTIKSLLSYATKKLSPESIIIINDNSSQKAVKAVRSFKGVNLVNKDEILDLIEWDKLGSLINLNQKPKGKGTTAMAGYLFSYIYNTLKNKRQRFIFQTDADIKNQFRFKPLEYLTYGILQIPKAVYVKIAQGGRNNETHMAVRSALVMLEDLDKVIEDEKAFKIAQRARQLFENLAKYKWILGGTFAIYDELAFSRPFASGYLEETLITAFVEDWIMKNGCDSVQVSDPNHCYDGNNSFIKENFMVQIPARLVMTLTLIDKPVCDWTLNDIEWINQKLMNKPKPIALIPPKKDLGPVIVKVVANERILPSIKMLDENGLINWDKATSFFKRKNCFKFSIRIS